MNNTNNAIVLACQASKGFGLGSFVAHFSVDGDRMMRTPRFRKS